MSILAELKRRNIILPPTDLNPEKSPYQFKCDCPNSYCKQSRPNDPNPLTVEIYVKEGYAEWRCRHCLQSDHIGEKPEPAEAAPDDATFVDPAKSAESLPPEALEFLAAKGMTEETAAKYRLGYDGRRKAIKVPYLDGAQIINFAYIRITDGVTKMERPEAATFYGLPQMGQNSEPVTMAQRELDAIILMERGIPNVIAVPNGGNVIDKADDFNKEPDKFGYLSRASKSAREWHQVRFAFDDDKDGLALRQELARRLGPGRCLAAKLSHGNVTQTYLKTGADGLCADIQEAKALPIFGLFSVDDFESELKAYYEYGMASGVSTGWSSVDKLYTVVPGQLTVITGIPNSGKSEWVDALTFNLALAYGWRFAAFSPENGKEAHTVKLIEKRVEMSADPKSRHRMSYDTMMAGAQWVRNHYYFIENTESLPTLDWILDRAKDAALRYGIKGLIIDPWNRIEKKLPPGKSETDYVAESIPKILRFGANQGVHVWLVVHPKQQQKNQKTGNIEAPTLYDMAGSAHFVNMADNGIVIHRSHAIDDTTEVLVRKIRFKHVGRRGETKLRYNKETGRYDPLDEEMTAEQLDNAARYKARSNGDIDAIKTYEVD